MTKTREQKIAEIQTRDLSDAAEAAEGEDAERRDNLINALAKVYELSPSVLTEGAEALQDMSLDRLEALARVIAGMKAEVEPEPDQGIREVDDAYIEEFNKRQAEAEGKVVEDWRGETSHSTDFPQAGNQPPIDR